MNEFSISRRTALGWLASVGAEAALLSVAPSALAKTSDWTAANRCLKLCVHADGTYDISVLGRRWLMSGPTAFHCGDWYAHSENRAAGLPLKRVSIATGIGNDRLGTYSYHATTWLAGSTPVVASVLLYHDRPCIIFRQEFPEGVKESNTTSPVPPQLMVAPTVDDGDFHQRINDSGICTIFPSFRISRLPDLGYLTYEKYMALPKRGRGLNGFCGGTESGVPLVLFDEELHTLVLSPLNHFLNAVQVASSDFDDCLACGVSGRVSKLPAHFRQEFVLYAGQGVNHTMYGWGSTLLERGGKSRQAALEDNSAKHLGYWTGNGGYYYYNTEPGKNYESTIVDVASDLKARGIPARYMHLDSWWYQKGSDQGVFLWQPRHDVFPDGLAGLAKKIDLPLAAHNRFFSAHNAYDKLYPFRSSPNASVPASLGCWEQIMRFARENRIILYEQDWLNEQYEQVTALQTDPLFADRWLEQMSAAAEAEGIRIMYCTPLPSHYLASTACKAVTQIRASRDYQPGGDQWQIGLNAMLAWSLGLLPFKDTFWSTERQPGAPNWYWYSSEPNCELQALVSILSAGSVGPGDKIGLANKELIRRVCRADGVLLKPDKPATPVDSCFKPGGPSGQVWSTHSRIGERKWGYLFVADQKTPIALSLQDLNLPHSKHIAFEAATRRTVKVDAAHMLACGGSRRQPADVIPFQYFVIAPQVEGGVCFLGEVNKFVPVSKERFTSISTDLMKVTLTALKDEEIELGWHCDVKPESIVVDGKVVAITDRADESEVQGATARYDRPTGLVTVSLTSAQSGSVHVRLNVRA